MKHGAKRCLTRGQCAAMLTFLVALPLFALILLLPLRTVYKNTPLSEAATEIGKVRTALLLVHDEYNQLTGAVCVKIDTVRMCVDVIAYPKQTEVTNKTSVLTLKECYSTAGAKSAERLAEVTKESYDTVLRFSANGVGEFVSLMGGGVTYTLTETMGLLNAGEQWLTSQQLTELLSYNGWSDPIKTQAETHCGVIAAIVNAFLLPQYDLTTSFNALTTVCEDRLTIAQFTAIKEEFQKLAKSNTNGVCRMRVATGEVVGIGSNERYVLTE